jgi:hypothetical protein
MYGQYIHVISTPDCVFFHHQSTLTNIYPSCSGICNVQMLFYS